MCLYANEAAMCLDSKRAPLCLYANEATVGLYSDGASLCVCYILIDHQYIIFIEHQCIYILME